MLVCKMIIFYLLIKECPEHGQWNVEHQHPEHHFDLLNKTFLVAHDIKYSQHYIFRVHNKIQDL